MRSKLWLLVRMLLLSSGSRNIIKYEKDSKKRRKVTGTLVGSVILYVFFAALFLLLTIGMGLVGMIEGVPALCALFISVIELFFGVLRAGDYLFSKKDYEILMALPFSAKDLVSAKFITMYIRNLPSSVVSSMAMMGGYGYFARPAFYVYIIWIVLTVFLPMIPTVIASLIGVLSAGVGSKSKHKTAVQSVFIFIFTIALIFLGQIAGQLFATSERAHATLNTINNVGETAGGAYLPVKWFSDAIVKSDPLSIVLLIGVSIAVFEIVFIIISRFYRRINSRMISVATAKKDRKGGKNGALQPQNMKPKSIVNAIAFKEFRRFMGSTVYLTNMGVGVIIVLILSVLVLFVDINWLLSIITRGAPVKADVIIPAVPLILFFFIGMVPTTAVSWSLEGKNYWILQSLPITKKDICRGKMIFNLRLFIPFMIIGCVCFGISLHAGLPVTLLFILCGVVLCLYSTVFGMRCNLKHLNMEWDKEVEVVKQGSAVMFYMLPNMFITMAAAVISIFLGLQIGAVPVLLLITGIYAVIALIFYMVLDKGTLT